MDILAEALDWRMFPEPWHHPPYQRGFRLRVEYARKMGRRVPFR